MSSVTVRISVSEFSVRMATIGEWLNANPYEPIRYKYTHDEDNVVVTVDFAAEATAQAFAAKFYDVLHLSPQAGPTDRPHLSPV